MRETTSRRMPDGTQTFDHAEYLAAWQTLAAGVEAVTGGDVISLDPGFVVAPSSKHGGASFEIPVWAAYRMAEAAAEQAAALRLVADIRAAVGDDGRRMQDELIAWLSAEHAELARLRGERAVLDGLLRSAHATLYTLRDEDSEDGGAALRALLARIDAALGPATEDLLTGEGQ